MNCRHSILTKNSLFIGLWSVLVLLSPLSPDNVEAAEEAVEFEKAAAFRIEGKNQRAVEAFDRVLSVYPDHVAALVQKGAALEDQGKWKEAAKTYRQALEFDPENLAANRNLQQLLSSKMMDTPLGGATPAKEDLINSGLEALEARDFHRALEIFGLSSGLFPEDPRTLFYQAYTFEKQGKLQEALEIYAKTAETFPDHAAARIHRVICLLALGDRKLAQKEAQRARELLKDSLEVRALGRVTNGPWPSGSDAQTLKQWDKGQ